MVLYQTGGGKKESVEKERKNKEYARLNKFKHTRKGKKKQGTIYA
jgi:hypothetical protein